ncbi:hypothetical protein ACFLU5_10065 [Bacteroidota bacterium]
MDKEEQKAIDLAFQYKREEHYKKSVDQFKYVLNRYGENSGIVGMIGLLTVVELKDYTSALPFAKRYAELEPNSERASFNLFLCLSNLENEKEAEDEVKRYVQTGNKLDLYNTLFEENNLSVSDFN